jgi:transposase
VAPWARRTSRVEEVLLLVGHRTGGRAAEFLLKRLAMGVILRRVKRGARATMHAEQRLRVVGVDDWAWKKGQTYGTILVDLERRTVADLLPQRSGEQLAEWLQQDPEVEVITRDRFGLYAGGARRGAPQARHVADRFHLLLNLLEAVEKELARQRRRLVLPPGEEDQSAMKTVPVPDSRSRANPEVQTHRRQLVAERWRAKKELFARVRALHVSGRSASAIVRATGVGRRRVDKWIRCTRAVDSVPQEGHSKGVRPSARTSQPCADFSNPNKVRPISGGRKSCALNSLDMALSLDDQLHVPAPKLRKNPI